MLLPDFFEIIATTATAGSLQVRVKIFPTHRIFNGHFPGNPVTPGVVQMQMVKEVLQEQLKKPLKLAKMQSCKFLAILNPVETPEFDITLNYKEEDGAFIVQANGKSGDTTFFKLVASYVA